MKKTFIVKGMHCKSCEMILKESVEELDGVKNVDVNIMTHKVTIDFDDKKVNETTIKKIIEKQGYIVR